MVANMERRLFEVRFVPGEGGEDRTLSGIAVPYGVPTRLPWGREQFEAGAFGKVADLDVILNLQHERTAPIARTGGGGLRLIDDEDALRVEATLPETRAADDALELVRRRVLRGLSIEFFATAESFENDLRRIQSAHLGGVSVVDSPQYSGAEVERRAKEVKTMFKRATIWL